MSGGFSRKGQEEAQRFMRAGTTGHQTSFICMGCNRPRLNAGSVGVGVRKRCAECQDKRRASK